MATLINKVAIIQLVMAQNEARTIKVENVRAVTETAHYLRIKKINGEQLNIAHFCVLEYCIKDSVSKELEQ